MNCAYDAIFMEPPSYIQMCAVVCICAYQMYTVLCIRRLLYGDPPRILKYVYILVDMCTYVYSFGHYYFCEIHVKCIQSCVYTHNIYT